MKRKGKTRKSAIGRSSCKSAKPMKRMIWFLVEGDEGLLLGRPPMDKLIHRILHVSDLTDDIITDKCLPSFVDFRIKGVLVENKLILASDELSTIIHAILESAEKHMLVQYHDENKSQLVHEVVPQKDVNNRNSTLLTSHEDRDYIEKVLIDLKSKCFNEANEENLGKYSKMDDRTWLFIQYSPNPNTTVYTVINYSQTVLHDQNLKKDKTVLQAVVMSFSQDKAEMEAKLNRLTQFCLSVKLPKPASIDGDMGTMSNIFKRTLLFKPAKKKYLGNEYRREDIIRRQATTTLDIFETITTMDEEPESRKDDLDEVIILATNDISL